MSEDKLYYIDQAVWPFKVNKAQLPGICVKLSDSRKTVWVQTVSPWSLGVCLGRQFGAMTPAVLRWEKRQPVYYTGNKDQARGQWREIAGQRETLTRANIFLPLGNWFSSKPLPVKVIVTGRQVLPFPQMPWISIFDVNVILSARCQVLRNLMVARVGSCQFCNRSQSWSWDFCSECGKKGVPVKGLQYLHTQSIKTLQRGLSPSQRTRPGTGDRSVSNSAVPAVLNWVMKRNKAAYKMQQWAKGKETTSTQ